MHEVAETIVIPAGARRLEGRWRAGSRGGAVVAPPHPEYGGRLDHPVVTTVADALAARGIASLAFNWRGVGASDGAPTGDAAAAEADYGAALDELARRSAGPVVAAGYSFGAGAALRLAERADRLLLVAPPVAFFGAAELRACPRPVHVVVGDADDYAPAALVTASMPAREDARLTVLDGTDHFFARPGVFERLAAALRAALA